MGHGPRISPPHAPQLTHFLGLSLVTPASRPQLQTSLEMFRDAARNDKELQIPEEVAKHAIRPLDTLHLTLCTFSLSPKEPEKLEEVINRLREIDLKKIWQEAYVSKNSHCNDISESSPQASPSMDQNTTQARDKQDSQDHRVDSLPLPRVTLKGMSTMKSAASTTVVYAPPDDSTGALQRFCEAIREDFKSYLPKGAVSRDLGQETAKKESTLASIARPTLESFPHPDSYKSDISVQPAPALAPPPVPNLPISLPAAPTASETQLSNRQRKRLVKEARGELPHLILHATLLNTIYIRGRGRKSRPLSIDARPLIERFKDMVWMENIRMEKLCLYRMGAKDVLDENGNKTGVVRYIAEAERELGLT